MMKSCLKCSAAGPSHALFAQPDSPRSPGGQSVHSNADSDGGSPSASPEEMKRKSVTFMDEGEVFYVDDWDRSPTAIVERLTYKDVYELKELHISLPRINLATKCTKEKAKTAT
ncbi:hypothetical protein BDW22DRAFT_1356492 [Trametopsis cervina]|nr:hypothetical protein BDW22DRAFT_1356492 [Trametopsis cervina]